MAKLYFRYGTVGSAKTMNLLAVAHNYRSQKKAVFILKPAMDDRFGSTEVRSRSGLSCPADFQLGPNTTFLYKGEPLTPKSDSTKEDEIQIPHAPPLSCLLIDEVQFLSPFVIEQLYWITVRLDIPVICYGLKNNFKKSLFDGSKRLLELADSIEEVKTTCFYCNCKATHNLKFINNKAVSSGPSIDLGADEKYKPTCKKCYEFKVKSI